MHLYIAILVLSEQQLAEEKKKAHSLTDVMKKPTKVVLLKVNDYCVCRSKIGTYMYVYIVSFTVLIVCSQTLPPPISLPCLCPEYGGAW